MIVAAMLFLQGAQALDCDNAVTQADMNQCAGLEYREADRTLNAQWEETAAEMKRRDDSEYANDGRLGYFPALLKAQRAWLAYRDAHCTSYGYYARGGSMEPMLVAACKTDMTRERTQELRDLVTQ